MSTENVRHVVHLFEECHTRIQTLGELLLISCKARPVFIAVHDLELTSDNFVRYRDRVINHLNKMCILSKDISSQIHTERVQVEKQLHQPLVSLSTTIVTLAQLSAHIAYLMAVHADGSQPATAGYVSSHFELVQADLELKFVCARLKRSRVHDLSPHVLVELCSTITKSLSCIADICKEAAEKISDSNEQDQFKLCVKAITSTTGCLVSSVKSLKSWRQQQQHHHHTSTTADSGGHLQRVINFCLPVSTTSTALAAFATEEKFLGSPACLSPQGENLYKSVLGMCMSMVSASVQVIKAARDLLHDPTKRKHKDRISLCVESISRTAFRLRDFLLSYDFASKSGGTTTTAAIASPGHGDDKHLAVIKDGEISTPFPAVKKDRNEDGHGEEEVSTLKRDKHNYSSSNMNNVHVALSSPLSISTNTSGIDAFGSPTSSHSPSQSFSPSSSKLLSMSPLSSPKSSSSKSSDSKKKHHRKSSSKHLANLGHSGSHPTSPQHTPSSSSPSSSLTGVSPLAGGDTPSPQLSPISPPIILPSSSPVAAAAVTPSSWSLPPQSSSPPPPLSPPQPLSLSSPLTSSSSLTAADSCVSSSSSSSETLESTVKNMKEESVLSMDIQGKTKTHRM